MKRVELGLSQRALGDRVGVTAQQIEKYEHGPDRMSVSKVFAVAQALGTPVGWFFDGAPKNKPYVSEDRADDLEPFLTSTGAFDVVRIWPGLNLRRRSELLKLMQSMEWAP